MPRIYCTRSRIRSNFSWYVPSFCLIQTLTCSDLIDSFKMWGWEKTRVYLVNLLWPKYIRCDTLVADLDEAPPSQDAIEKLKGFIVNLLHDQVEFDDVSKETLGKCCRLAPRVGLAIHKDLRRWCWSYDHVGVMEGPFPLQRIPDDDLLNEVRPVQEHVTKSIMSSKFSSPKETNIVDDKMYVLSSSLWYNS